FEEIVGEIKRILAEDERAAAPPLIVPAPDRAAHEDGEILELTQMLTADGSVRKLSPIAGNYDDLDDRREPTIGPPAPPPPPPSTSTSTSPTPPPEAPIEELVSQKPSEAAAAAFAALTAAQPPAEDTPVHSPLIDGMTRELLRPMLQTWLDENLPALVERLVQ